MQVKKFLYNVILTILIIGCVICSTISFKGFKEMNDVKDNYKSIATSVKKEKDQDNIDFNKLKKINPDITGWIKIPGTPIDYPIVMANGNNDFYLDHDVEGNYSQYGAIFTDYRLYGNPLEQKNCIIYGHNMGRWTNVMFSSLMSFVGQKYYDKHKNIYIYFEEQKVEYRIISVREVDYSSYAYTITFDLKKNFNEWIEKSISDSMIKCDTKDISKEVNKAITLSTCTYGTNKLVVVCVPVTNS